MRDRSDATKDPIDIVEFTNSFYLGGTEGQVVELLRALPDRYRIRVAVLQAAGPLLEEVRQLGFAPRAFPPHGSLAHPNTALQIARIVRWLRQEKIQLIHVHDFFSTLLAVPAAKLAGCKVVVGRLDLGHWHGRFRGAVLARLTRMADHVVANAEAIRRMLIHKEGIPDARVTVIHNGIDLQRFDERMKAPLVSPLPPTGVDAIALLVANMNHPVKRQEDFLVALAHARAQGYPICGFLVGDGPRRQELEALARELGLEGGAHFLGHRTDVPAICARATVGVLCSTAEGLSNAIIEGMAARLPMVVTKVGGNPELIEQGKRGLQVPPCEPFDLSTALAWILSNRQAAQEMGEAGRRYVEEDLSLSRLVENHDRLYQQVVHGIAPRSQELEEPRAGEVPLFLRRH